jgi:multidrug efflux pump subunit AcrB
MSIPKFAINNFQLTLTAFVVFLALGLSAFLTMPQREDPSLKIANIFVVAVYPGASPADIESQVVDPIEEAINELDDIKEMETTIRDGVAVTEVEFTFGVDPDKKFDDVQRQVNGIREELPQDLYQLDFTKASTNTVTIMQLALVSEKASYQILKREAERVKRTIEKVDGVRKVEIDAYPEQEVRIALDPVKMNHMNVSLDQIEQAIQSNNANIPGGALKVSNKLFNIKTSGAYDDLEQIRNTVVGSYEGRIVYLKNVADVFFTYEDERWLARYNQKRGIYVNVQQKEGYNIFSVTNPIKEDLSHMDLAEDIEIAYVFDQSLGVEDRVSGFLGNLLQGILLVGIIIFLALGVRSASIVMMAIPLSILMGLWAVSNLDFALQQMSIAGLVVALGLLVDNSIAIIENIERFLGLGYSSKEAAISGTEQLVSPITSATLTTILAFIPIILMPETTGAFIRALPVTVTMTLTASLIIAVTLTPLLASWILKKKKKTEVRKSPVLFKWMKKFVEGPYRNALSWVLKHKVVTISSAVLLLIGALALFPLVGVSFFPKAEKPQFRVTATLPNGSNIEAVDEVMQYVESVLEKNEQVSYYATNVGHGNPRIYYNVTSTNYSNTYGEAFVVLKEYDVDGFYEVLEELRNEFSHYTTARIDVREFVQGPPSEAPIAIKIFGTDLDQLQAYARQVEGIVKNTEGALNVENPIRTNSTDLRFHINRDKAMMLGVPIYQIDKTIRSFVNGTVVGTYRDKEAEDYNIVLRYDYEDRFQLDDFDKLTVTSATGRFIPLEQLASISFDEAPSRITHLDRERTATILADLGNDYSLDAVVANIRTELDQLDWADGYSFTFKGDIETRNSSFGGMGIASGIALLLIFGVLIVQFKSFSQPLIIFSALPLAIIGSILALLITGISFSFTAFIGLTSLIGIAINNSIVLVDFANKLREQGASVLEAAQTAGEVRFIPIVLTTLTTILGLLPLTLSGGSLWSPMGWTIIGGLLTSTTFVLLLVPILYQLFTRE